MLTSQDDDEKLDKILNGIEDEEELGQILEARMASRQAINLMMKDMKNNKKMKVWVPGGHRNGKESKNFHTNVTNAEPANRRYKSGH